MTLIKITKGSPEALVKRMFFLAWKACGGPLGMGFFQDRGSEQTEEQVWKCVYNSEDYPGGNLLRDNKPGNVYGDYVMGRMMKVGFKWSHDIVTCNDGDNWRRDYQAFCGKYNDFVSLALCAAKEIDVEFQVEVPV